MRSVARLEVTEEDPAQHADDGRPSGNHVDLKHLTAFMNSQEVFFFLSRSPYLVVFGKLLKDGSLKVCLQRCEGQKFDWRRNQPEEGENNSTQSEYGVRKFPSESCRQLAM